MELKKRRYFTDQTGVRHGLEDADTTIRPDGEKVRFVGFDAEETDQLSKNPDGTFTFERGEVGGDLYTDIVANIIDEGNFTNVDYTGERGYYGRELADINNPEGKGLDAQLYSSGIAKLAPWTSAENTKLKLEGDMYRKFFGDASDPYAKYREALDIERQSQGLRFKTKALDESYYDPNYHNDVAFRDFDRTIDNKPRSVLSGMGDAFGMGFDGIKEGAFGYLDAIGQMSDSEMLENLGEQGVSRARERLRETPDLILDYKEVNNLSTGFQYFLNNAAMSAPYMVTSFAALVAAAPLGLATGIGQTGILAIAGIPNSVIYAGQTWNDMEGELGFSQFLAASMSGVGQATLEFLALPTLMAPVKVFSKAGQEKIIKALMNKGATKEVAEAQVAAALAKNQKEFISTVVKTAGVRLQARDFAPFSAKSVGAAGVKGAGIESVTEVAQEGLQMATAAGFSDKEYSAAEVRDRLINAAIAGGSLGGGLGAAGNVYRQGKNKLNVQLRNRVDQERLNAYQQFHLQQVQENGRVLSVDEQIEREEQIAASEARESAANANVAPTTQRDDRTSTLTDEELVILLEGKPARSQKDPNRRLATPLEQAELDLESLEEIADSEGIPKDDPKYIKAINAAKADVKRARKFEERVRAEIAGRKDGTLKQLTFEEADALIDDDSDKTVLGGLEINQAGQDNFVTALANNYDNSVKGTRNYLKNNNKAAEYLSMAALGVSKMFRGLERVAIKPLVAIKDADVMDVIGRVFGALGDAVGSGQNFKEFQEEIVRRAKSLISESSIRSALVGKPGLMDHKDSLAISKMLIDFASANKGTRFGAFFAYNMLINFGTLKPSIGIPYNTLKEMLTSLETKTISEQDIEILSQLGFNTAVNEIMVSEIKQVNEVLNSELYQDNDIDLKNLITSQAEFEKFQQLYEAGMQLKKSYDYTWSITNARILKESKGRDRLTYNPDGWWKHQGFDWEAAKKNPAGFKAMLIKELEYSVPQADAIYERIAKRGETTINVVDSTSADRVTEDGTAKYSLLNPGNTGRPWLFSEAANQLFEAKSVLNWTNNNLFETANKRAIDTARYVANAKYFGEGGKKLHRMFRRIAKNGNLTPAELQQFAYYIKSSIDSANGNFNRIESPRMAAINSFISSWAVMAGLPLSMPSSIPEFGMVYFDVKDDEMFQKATSTLMKQLSGTFASALDAEVDRAQKLLGAAKLDVTQSTVVDRLATGERDIAFARMHEAFFKGVGITGVTQVQRRIEAVMGLDAIKHAFDILDLAPTKTVERFKKIGTTEVKIKVKEFNFSQFHEIEMEMYNQLTSLGINVQDMMELFKDLDSASRDSIFEITDGVDVGRLSDLNSPINEDNSKRVRDLTQREKAFRKLLRRNFQEDIISTRGQVAEFDKYIAEQADALIEDINSTISNALYRYINERIQLPGHSNRPLMFMDPHYQLLFQFQGFISAFTSNIIPKLYDRGLRRGHVKTKYDTFALIILLIALGGASQYLKDLIKFGKASPYLDDAGYIQRAVYASGVMGNYERIADAIVPLYPQRNEGIAGFVNLIAGEAGPGARNIQNVLTGAGQLIEGEGNRGLNTLVKTAPIIGPATGIRRGAADLLQGENPLKGKELPDTQDLKSFFLGTY